MCLQNHQVKGKAVQGFTLIELLIVITIVGILAKIAYPSYRLYILQSHRADAIAVLSQDQTILERCYAQNFAYNQTCAALPSFPQTSPQGYYTVTIANLTATTYQLTATAIGTQTQDTNCQSFTVDQANQRTATGTNLPNCWITN